MSNALLPDSEPTGAPLPDSPPPRLEYEAPRDQVKRRRRLDAVDMAVPIMAGISVTFILGTIPILTLPFAIHAIARQFTWEAIVVIYAGLSVWLLRTVVAYKRRLALIDATAVLNLSVRLSLAAFLLAVAVAAVIFRDTPW